MRGAQFAPAFALFLSFMTFLVPCVIWMWLKHKRHNSTVELIKTYIEQGKDPPLQLLDGLKNGNDSWAQGSPRVWRHVTAFGSLSAGFGVAYLAMVPEVMSARSAHPFLVMAIIMGALTLGALVNVLIQRKYDSK